MSCDRNHSCYDESSQPEERTSRPERYRRRSSSRPYSSSLLLLLGANAVFGSVVAEAQKPTQGTVIPTAPFERVLDGDHRSGTPCLQQFRCVETERGWVVSNNQSRTAEVIAAWRGAASKYEKIFGKPVPRGVVLLYVGTAAPDPSTLARSGARWNFSMNIAPGEITFSGLTDSVALAASQPQWTQSAREAIRQQRSTMTEAQLQDTIAQLWAARVHYLLHDDSGFLTHEIAHKWFDLGYPWSRQWNPARTWPRPSDWSGRDQWLNETVGVLMEGPYMSRARREKLVRFYGQTDAAHAYLVSLDTLFTMPHPMNGPHGPFGGDGDEAYVSAFYAQLRGVIDFLLERTNDSTVFGSIAAGQASGADMAEWLRTNGPRYGLPSTIAALDAAWRHWLTRKVHDLGLP